MHSGFGAYFYPFINVGTTSLGTSLTVAGINKWIRSIALSHKIGKMKILISDDGFVGIISSKQKTEQYLNVLFSASLFFELQSRMITTKDLCSIEWDEKETTFSILTMNPGALRNHIAFDRDGVKTITRLADNFPRSNVTIEKMKEILDKSYEVFSSKFKEEMVLIGNCWALSFDDSPKASFLYSWMLIEIFLKRIWFTHVDSLSISNSQKEKMKSFQSFDIINELTTTNKIGITASKVLHCLRKKRNKIVHDIAKVNISKKQAKRCTDIATKIFWNLYYNQKPFSSIK